MDRNSTPHNASPDAETPRDPQTTQRTRRRWRLVAGLCGALTVAAATTGGLHWILRADPTADWQRIETALDAEAWDDAEVRLRKYAQGFPDDARAQRALADVYLARAQRTQPEATYATSAKASRHLTRAAELAPADLELQQLALAALVTRKQSTAAAIVADRILALEPNDAGALLAKLDAPTSRDDQKAEAWFTKIVDRLARHDGAESIARAADLEHLLQAVRQAPNSDIARRRVGQSLDLFERLAAANTIPADRLANDTARLLRVAERFARAKDLANPEFLAEWGQLDARGERLRQAGIETGRCDLEVFYQSALAAFTRGDEAGFQLVEQGLATLASHPSDTADPTESQDQDADESRDDAELEDAPRTADDLRLLAASEWMLRRQASKASALLDQLSDSPSSQGAAALLGGWSALAQGKVDLAERDFQRAKKQLGEVAPVRMGTASVLLVQQRWRAALDQLDQVERDFDALTVEGLAWSKRFFGGERSGLHFWQMYAELKLGHWYDAQRHRQALAGTPLHWRAEALAITDLWLTDAKPVARRELADARCYNPRDLGLFALEIAMLRSDGRPDEAQRKIEEFAAETTDDQRQQLLFCGWLLKQGQPDLAWRQLERLATSPTDPESARIVTLLRAETKLAQGDAAETLRIVAPLATENRSALVAGLLAAASHARLRQIEQADASLAQAGAAQPDSVLLRHWRGEFSVSLQRWSQAIDDLSGSLDVASLRERAARQLSVAVRQLAEREPADAVAARLAPLLVRAPREPSLLVAQGELALRQGDLAAAELALAQAERFAPSDPALAADIADTWLRAKQSARALTAAQRALTLGPRQPLALLVASKAALALRQPQLTLDYTETLFALDPKPTTAALLRAEAFLAVRRVDDARRTLERALRSRPDFSGAYLALGKTYSSANQNERAIAVYRQGIAACPADRNLRRAELALLVQAQRANEAESATLEWTAIDESADTLLAIGEAYELGGELAVARDWYARVLDASEPRRRSAAHLLIGMNLLKVNAEARDPAVAQQARQHFESSIEAYPLNLVAVNNLAWIVCHDEQRPDDAVAILERARGNTRVGLWPTTFVHTFARVYRAAGRLDDARDTLRESLSMQPDQAPLMLELGLVLAEQRQPAVAREVLERALALGLSPADTTLAQTTLKQLEPPTVNAQ